MKRRETENGLRALNKRHFQVMLALHPVRPGAVQKLVKFSALMVMCQMAHLGGFEPPTARFVAEYSIQLSYKCVFFRKRMVCKTFLEGALL